MGQFAYASSKACFTHLSRMLGTIYKDIKVRVNVIAPAVFPSEMTTGKSDENNKSQIDPSSQNPAGRKGKESDMAATILFLAGKGGVYYNEQISESALACIAEDRQTDLACSFSVPRRRAAARCPISQVDTDFDRNQSRHAFCIDPLLFKSYTHTPLILFSVLPRLRSRHRPTTRLSTAMFLRASSSTRSRSRTTRARLSRRPLRSSLLLASRLADLRIRRAHIERVV